MRIVLDTNVVVSALLWEGTPHALLSILRASSSARLFSSEPLIEELLDVLGRPGCARRLAMIGRSPADLSGDYLSIVEVVEAKPIEPTASDPDDDQVLACAAAANAGIIVTGDRALLKIEHFRGIRVLDPAEAFGLITSK